MKRFLLSLIAIVVTSICFAQDIIVKKDGTAILSKIIEVTGTEVSYQKYHSSDERIYVMSLNDVLKINFEKTESTNIVSTTNSTIQKFNNNTDLSKKYAGKGKRQIILGSVLGGSLTTIGLIVMSLSPLSDEDGSAALLGGGSALFVGGAVLTSTLLATGIKNCKKSSRVTSTSFYQHPFNIGKHARMTADLNLLNDQTQKNPTLGIGFHLNL